MPVEAVRRVLKQRVESEPFEIDRAIGHAQDLEETTEPRLRREDERVARRLATQDAERRDREQYVSQRARMNREGQGRSSATAASWRRPFVASAELE